MEKIFHTQTDWFEAKIMPAIKRRTIYASLILVICVFAWVYFESWIPIVIGMLVVAERVFEIAGIPSTKNIISSLSVSASEKGLSFTGAGIKGNLLYPWSSLSFKVQNEQSGTIEAITIEDKNRKRSKIKLVGYEAMSELFALIKENAGKS
jgi:hypothetical protein